MNEFSPKAETNDMELPRTMVRSLRSLFLHLGASLYPPPAAAFLLAQLRLITRDILPFLASFVNITACRRVHFRQMLPFVP